MRDTFVVMECNWVPGAHTVTSFETIDTREVCSEENASTEFAGLIPAVVSFPFSLGPIERLQCLLLSIRTL